MPLLFGLFVHIKIENNISYSIKESLVFFIYNLPLSHFTSSDTSYLAKFLQPFQILLNLACGQPYALCRLSCPDLRILGNQFVNLATCFYELFCELGWLFYVYLSIAFYELLHQRTATGRNFPSNFILKIQIPKGYMELGSIGGKFRCTVAARCS